MKIHEDRSFDFKTLFFVNFMAFILKNRLERVKSARAELVEA